MCFDGLFIPPSSSDDDDDDAETMSGECDSFNHSLSHFWCSSSAPCRRASACSTHSRFAIRRERFGFFAARDRSIVFSFSCVYSQPQQSSIYYYHHYIVGRLLMLFFYAHSIIISISRSSSSSSSSGGTSSNSPVQSPASS